MASATGIEIGPDSYLFTDVRPAGDEAEILSIRRFSGSEWPADHVRFVDALRSIRRHHRLPRRTGVVSWIAVDGIDGAALHDPLAGLTAAGFEIASVMTPSQALARIGTTVRRGAPSDAIAWLALNTHGASIAIVGAGELLLSRTFPWTYRDNLETSQAQLLQRYVLMSHIAPELDHGFKTVRERHGAAVSLIVTCGNLPELRSLTLPLIEEFDIEVETLDSTDGLLAGRNLQPGGLTDFAPTVRLAAAAALTAAAVPSPDSMLTQGARFAAAAAVIAALAWAGYSFWHGSQSPRPLQSSVPQRSPSAPGTAAPVPVATRGSDEPNRATPPASDTPDRALPEQSRPIPSDTKTAAPPQASSPAGTFDEPLPRIDTVLIDQDRRLAILDGAVVGIGDSVGSRVVVAIAREAILLREPSGRIVRIRPRIGM
jgi:hypothetical protein